MIIRDGATFSQVKVSILSQVKSYVNKKADELSKVGRDSFQNIVQHQ